MMRMKDVLLLESVSVEREGKKIIDSITWKIRRGENWALIGPNGAGKTTLLKIVAGMMWPSEGSVCVLGAKFGKDDLRRLRKMTGWVSSFLAERVPCSQNALSIILSGKHSSFGLYENPSDSDIEEARKIMDFLGCKKIEKRRFDTLSQGEKQKVLIGRALMGKPKLLILDEPCAGLDMKARNALLSTVSRICKMHEASVIYVTHHLEEIVDEITRVFMLKEGKMFFSGKRNDALTEKRVRELFS